ncbi:MAG: SUMF1/EgtB/PvdO family nonheme iron enzyme, partial [Verrucomicrobiota bacterium]
MNRQFRIFLVLPIICWLVSCGENPTGPSATQPEPEESVAPTEGMVLIPGGNFKMGGDAGEMDGDSHSHQTAYPIHEVHVDAFWIDETEVTNQQYTEFVEETGYVTFAEKPLPESTVRELEEMARYNIQRLEREAAQATGRDKEAILDSIARIKEASALGGKAGSIVFAIPKGEIYDPQDITQWWRLVPGATWRTPGGPGTTLDGLDDHPVVNLTYEDAEAYSKWAGKRLPTETEWEKAARGGLDRKPYVWGDEMFPNGEDEWMANI